VADVPRSRPRSRAASMDAAGAEGSAAGAAAAAGGGAYAFRNPLVAARESAGTAVAVVAQVELAGASGAASASSAFGFANRGKPRTPRRGGAPAEEADDGAYAGFVGGVPRSRPRSRAASIGGAGIEEPAPSAPARAPAATTAAAEAGGGAYAFRNPLRTAREAPPPVAEGTAALTPPEAGTEPVASSSSSSFGFANRGKPRMPRRGGAPAEEADDGAYAGFVGGVPRSRPRSRAASIGGASIENDSTAVAAAPVAAAAMGSSA
jgi:hypothetical protein